MKRLPESAETGDAGDSDQEDPEQLLNEWLGELDNLTGVSERKKLSLAVRSFIVLNW